MVLGRGLADLHGSSRCPGRGHRAARHLTNCRPAEDSSVEVRECAEANEDDLENSASELATAFSLSKPNEMRTGILSGWGETSDSLTNWFVHYESPIRIAEIHGRSSGQTDR